jgi:periplasmic nitrate reductase NapD
MTDVVHISSLLVSARPAALNAVEAHLAQIDIAEIAHIDPLGKIIVTLETGNESEIVQALTDIQLIDGVVSAALVFHQMDEDLDREVLQTT